MNGLRQADFMIQVGAANGKSARRVVVVHMHRGEFRGNIEASDESRLQFIEGAAKRFGFEVSELAWMLERIASETGKVDAKAPKPDRRLPAANGQSARESLIAPELVCLADVEPEPIEWVWADRIPRGKVTLLAGDPGLGKSLVTLSIAATVSCGAAFPDAPNNPRPAGGVVLLSAEDDLADTIKPRLIAQGADCTRITALTAVRDRDEKRQLDKRPFDLVYDLPGLSEAIERTPDCCLVVVDPISAYLGKTDSHVNSEVRAIMAKLAEVAEEKRVAIVCVDHLRKGEGPALHRVMGSLAFVAAARVAWVVVKDKLDTRRRLLLSLKNNLAADTANGLAFTIEPHGEGGAPVICWVPDYKVTIAADEALAPEPKKMGRPAVARSDAEDWLRAALCNGPRPATEVQREATEAQYISPRTLMRAKKAVGVIAFHPDPKGPWLWRLPGELLRQNGDGSPVQQDLWHSGNLEQNTRIFDGSGGQNATSPKVECIGAEPSTNGHSAPETEWMP